MYDNITLKIPRDYEKVELNLGDSGDFIRIAVQQPDESVKDLAGWGGRVVAYSSPTGTTYMVSGAITVISGSEGTVSYPVTGTDTDTSGRFPAYLILTSGVQVVTVAGWQIHVVPRGMVPTITEYCTVEDVLGDSNAYTLLRLEDYPVMDILDKIQKHSSNIDNKIGAQSSGDRVIVQLCKYMVLCDIAGGLPAAKAQGEDRISLLGVVAKWESYIRETLADYGYGVPAPLFSSP
jgi:hypothetical protein